MATATINARRPPHDIDIDQDDTHTMTAVGCAENDGGGGGKGGTDSSRVVIIALELYYVPVDIKLHAYYHLARLRWKGLERGKSLGSCLEAAEAAGK